MQGKRLNGLRFRRQAIIIGWIADFYCPTVKLVVELDGQMNEDTRIKDIQRARAFNRIGLSVLRIRSYRVFEDPEGVLEEIPLRARVRGPLQLRGFQGLQNSPSPKQAADPHD